MGTNKVETVEVKGAEYLNDIKAACEKRGMSIRQLCEWVIGCQGKYITGVIRASDKSSRINKEVYEKSCEWMGVSPDKYVYIAEVEQNKPKNNESSIADGLVTGITSIYNKLNELYAEQKTTNALLREILRYQRDYYPRIKTGSEAVSGMQQTLNTATSDIHKIQERTGQIFTEVKYGGKL